MSKELLLNSSAKYLRRCLRAFAKENLINNKEIIEKEITGKRVLGNLISFFENGLLQIKNGCLCFDDRIASLISEEYMIIFLQRTGSKDYKSINLSAENVYFTLLLITDQISGMTDTHCIELYRKINGI